jgi:hypothetical protein
MTLFDQLDMASITAPEFPGERLIARRNADIAAERAYKREDLLPAPEKDLARIEAGGCAQARSLAGCLRDRGCGRRGAQHPQDAQAFRSRHH